MSSGVGFRPVRGECAGSRSTSMQCNVTLFGPHPKKNPTEAVVRELLNLALQASPSGFSHVASADLVLAIQVFEAENVGPDANGVIYAAVPTGLGRWHRFPPMLMFLLLDAINVGSFRIAPTSPTQEP